MHTASTAPSTFPHFGAHCRQTDGIILTNTFKNRKTELNGIAFHPT